MQFREDKKSGSQLSVLGFGCMRFPKSFGSIDMQKTEKLVLDAIDKGVNYFDTAYLYGGSEEALGTILKNHNVRDKVNIATKLPLVFCNKKDDIDKFFNKQLQRLQTDHIDYYLMHMLTDLNSWEKLCNWDIKKWIEEKKAKGQIKNIGFSFHGTQEEFLKILDAYDWDFCQIQYNYSDENYQAGVTGLKKAAEKGIPVIIMEPLLGGKLANGLPDEAVKLFQKSNPKYSTVGWALRWLLDQPEVTVILSGMNEDRQLEENIEVANECPPGTLKPDEYETYKKVKDIFQSSYKVHCTGCNYCMPCPKNVNIPACFAAYNTSYTMGLGAGRNQYMLSSGATSETQSSAGLCVKCGKCEKHCPQGIPIRKELENVRQRMEPFWYRIGVRAVRIFLRKGRKN